MEIKSVQASGVNERTVEQNLENSVREIPEETVNVNKDSVQAS